MDVENECWGLRKEKMRKKLFRSFNHQMILSNLSVEEVRPRIRFDRDVIGAENHRLASKRRGNTILGNTRH